MKKLSFLLLFAIAFLSAQNQRLVYEYRFVLDTLKKDSLKTEMMILDIKDSKSEFYSYQKFQSDSLAMVSIQNQIKSGTGNISINKKYNGNINYSVKKDLKLHETNLLISIGGNQYLVKEDRKLDWKILPETQKIGNWNCQKVVAKFGGRIWTAWFTTELPFSDGPYKFQDLPGLIVQISDEKLSHNFSLIAVKNLKINDLDKLNEENNLPTSVSFGLNSNAISINNEKLAKVYQDYRKDPTASLRQQIAGRNVTFSKNGVPLNTNEFLKEREKYLKQKIAENNNLIEKSWMK